VPPSDPPRSRTAVLRDFRREQIVGAAREIIARRGYANTSMADIARAAGLSRSTVYLCFESKEAMLRTAFIMGQAELDRRIATVDALSGDVREQLARAIETTFAYFDESKPFLQAVVAEAYLGAGGEGEDSVRIGALGRSIRVHIQSALARGIASGALRPHDVRESSLVLALTVQAAVGVRVRDPIVRVPAGRAARTIVGYFLDGVRPTEAKAEEPKEDVVLAEGRPRARRGR
jgi:AcrR family transcriptional regulator